MNRCLYAIRLKLFCIIILLSGFNFIAEAQNCFEISSILVDACGSPEGENEMVRFNVGNATLNVADLDIIWPNTANGFNGICQDSITASKVDSLNNGIAGCGLLIEPISGVLPANSKVLLVTSTNFNISFNSFANLNDTLIIIFQCAGNVNGHFANNSSAPGLRTLIMSFLTPLNCIDSVTYDRTLLVNQGGGIGGSSSFNDGALVEFDNAGNATYLNYGCQALVTFLNADAGNDILVCNPGVVTFNGSVTGTYTSIQWSGGAGTFSSPNAMSTTYIPGTGETGWITFTFTASGLCSSSSVDSLHIYIAPSNPAPILSAVGNVLTCSLQSTNLNYQWQLNGSNTGGTSYILNAASAGCYRVIVTDSLGCSITSDTVCIVNQAINDWNEITYIGLNPNPAQELLHLKIESNELFNSLQLQLMDVTGRIISQNHYAVLQNLFEADLDISDLYRGIYFLSLRSDNKIKVVKVMKD